MNRLDTLKQFVEKDPNDTFSRYGLAMELVGTARFEEAVGQFLDLKSRDPRYVALYYQLAKTYEAMEKFPDAKATYSEGMTVAREAGNQHAFSELQGALEELEDHV